MILFKPAPDSVKSMQTSPCSPPATGRKDTRGCPARHSASKNLADDVNGTVVSLVPCKRNVAGSALRPRSSRALARDARPEMSDCQLHVVSRSVQAQSLFLGILWGVAALLWDLSIQARDENRQDLLKIVLMRLRCCREGFEASQLFCDWFFREEWHNGLLVADSPGTNYILAFALDARIETRFCTRCATSASMMLSSSCS